MAKNQFGLFFTGSKIKLFKNLNNLLAGEWCLNNLENDLIKKKSIKISNRELKRSIVKDADVCNYYYSRLLDDLILHCSRIYKLNWNKRSWEIFLGPWVNRYVSIVYDRFNLIGYILKNYRIKKIQIVRDKKFNLLSQDQVEFRDFSQKDDWNLKLFSKLYIKYFNKKNIRKDLIKINSKNYNYTENTTAKINIFRLIFNKIFNFLSRELSFLFNIVFCIILFVSLF